MGLRGGWVWHKIKYMTHNYQSYRHIGKLNCLLKSSGFPFLMRLLTLGLRSKSLWVWVNESSSLFSLITETRSKDQTVLCWTVGSKWHQYSITNLGSWNEAYPSGTILKGCHRYSVHVMHSSMHPSFYGICRYYNLIDTEVTEHSNECIKGITKGHQPWLQIQGHSSHHREYYKYLLGCIISGSGGIWHIHISLIRKAPTKKIRTTGMDVINHKEHLATSSKCPNSDHYEYAWYCKVFWCLLT